MSNEIEVHGSTGLTLYGLVRNYAGQVWRPATPAFEAYNSANYANYATAVALTEQGATGVYLGDFPTGITTPANYRIDIRRRVGGSPAVSDPAYALDDIKWSGTAEIVDGDVNVLYAAGTAWNSGAIGASTLASDTITAAKIAADAIGASELAADAVTEIQSGLATAAELAKVPKSDSNVTWNATAAAQIQTEAADALSAYDPPTKAELDSAVAPLALTTHVQEVEDKIDTLQTSVNDLPTNSELATALGTADDAVLAAIGNLNNLSSVGAQAAAEAALAAYGAALEASVQGLNDLSAAQVNAEVDAALGDYDGPTNTEMIARTLPSAEYATAANLLTLDGKVVTIDNIVDAIKVSTDRFETMIQLDGAVYRFTVNALEMAPSGGGGGGDPWVTELPGSYTPGQAGYIVGNNLDAQISELLGQQVPAPQVVDECADLVNFDAGEKKPVHATLTATTGTVTIDSATVTLFDGLDNVIGTLEDEDATTIQAGAGASRRVTFELDTEEPVTGDDPLDPGNYVLVFTINSTGSDGIERVNKIAVGIQVI